MGSTNLFCCFLIHTGWGGVWVWVFLACHCFKHVAIVFLCGEFHSPPSVVPVPDLIISLFLTAELPQCFSGIKTMR